MFHLERPSYLLLALAIPPLLWLWARQRRSAVRHPVAGTVKGLPAGRAWWARRGGLALRGLSLLALVLALAGPRWPDLQTRVATEGIAIMLAVDVSGSMGEADFEWNRKAITRLEAVKRVFRLFVVGGEAEADGLSVNFEGRATDRIGLVTFGTRAEAPCSPTLSHSALVRLLDEEQPRQAGEGETNVSDALALALHRLEKTGARRKVLILLSDGEHNQVSPPSGWTPRQAAHVAAGLGIPIYAVDAGGAVPVTATEDKDREAAAIRAQGIQTLKEVAHISGGRYFTARDTAALLDTCRVIDQLERERIESFHYRRYHEAYPWCALTSFVLLVSALALDLTVWRRLP
jgi:Ca-activated chloride channel family protein